MVYKIFATSQKCEKNIDKIHKTLPKDMFSLQNPDFFRESICKRKDWLSCAPH